MNSESDPVAGIPSTCLARACDFDYLPSFKAVIAGYRVTELYSGELSVFETTVNEGCEK